MCAIHVVQKVHDVHVLCTVFHDIANVNFFWMKFNESIRKVVFQD